MSGHLTISNVRSLADGQVYKKSGNSSSNSSGSSPMVQKEKEIIIRPNCDTEKLPKVKTVFSLTTVVASSASMKDERISQLDGSASNSFVVRCVVCRLKCNHGRLKKHIFDTHFPFYKPYKCQKCIFKCASVEIFLKEHCTMLDDHKKVDIIGEKSRRLELLVELFYNDSFLLKHGKEDFAMSRIRYLKGQLLKHVPQNKRENLLLEKYASTFLDLSLDSGVSLLQFDSPAKSIDAAAISNVRLTSFDDTTTATSPVASTSLVNKLPLSQCVIENRDESESTSVKRLKTSTQMVCTTSDKCHWKQQRKVACINTQNGNGHDLIMNIHDSSLSSSLPSNIVQENEGPILIVDQQQVSSNVLNHSSTGYSPLCVRNFRPIELNSPNKDSQAVGEPQPCPTENLEQSTIKLTSPRRCLSDEESIRDSPNSNFNLFDRFRRSSQRNDNFSACDFDASGSSAPRRSSLQTVAISGSTIRRHENRSSQLETTSTAMVPLIPLIQEGDRRIKKESQSLNKTNNDKDVVVAFGGGGGVQNPPATFQSTCDFCQKVCGNTTLLRQHLLEEHCDGFQGHYCSLCSFRSANFGRALHHGRSMHQTTKCVKWSKPNAYEFSLLIKIKDSLAQRNVDLDLSKFEQ